MGGESVQSGIGFGAVPTCDDRDRRFTPAAAAGLRVVERRGAKDGSPGVALLRGLAAVFNVWSPVYYDFRERIAPNFFDDVLTNDVRCLFNHSPDYVLGRTTPGTLRLAVVAEGLSFDCDAPGSGFLSDIAVGPVERGDISGCSFSFLLPPSGADTWAKGADGVWERTLLKCAELFDVGPVTYPWYPETNVDAKRAVEARSAAIARGEVAGVTAPPAGPGWEAELRLREMLLP